MLADRLGETEVIIRRIPPSEKMETVKQTNDGGLRPTSATLYLRDGETGLSCSRLSITSPVELLRQIDESTASGWSVAMWVVKDIPRDLEVVITPSDPPSLDLGHCEIRPKPGVKFSDKLASKLARKGRIVLPE